MANLYFSECRKTLFHLPLLLWVKITRFESPIFNDRLFTSLYIYRPFARRVASVPEPAPCSAAKTTRRAKGLSIDFANLRATRDQCLTKVLTLLPLCSPMLPLCSPILPLYSLVLPLTPSVLPLATSAPLSPSMLPRTPALLPLKRLCSLSQRRRQSPILSSGCI